MLSKFCMAQDLRAFIADSLPDSMDEARDAFYDVFEDEKRGSLMNDILAFDQPLVMYNNTTKLSKLEDETHKLLKSVSHSPDLVPPRALRQRSITYRGVDFAIHTHSKANSFVVYGDISSNTWQAAKIVDILVQLQEDTHVQEDTVVVVVENFMRLTKVDADKDPYRKFAYSDVVGMLFYAKTSGKVVLDIRNIVCHFAHTEMKFSDILEECIHALPLDRVRS